MSSYRNRPSINHAARELANQTTSRYARKAGRKSEVEKHPKFDEIVTAILRGDTAPEVAKNFPPLKVPQVQRFARWLREAKDEVIRDRRRRTKVKIDEKLLYLWAEAQDAFERARDDGDWKAANDFLDKMLRTTQTEGEMSGEIAQQQQGPGTVLNVENMVVALKDTIGIPKLPEAQAKRLDPIPNSQIRDITGVEHHQHLGDTPLVAEDHDGPEPGDEAG